MINLSKLLNYIYIYIVGIVLSTFEIVIDIVSMLSSFVLQLVKPNKIHNIQENRAIVPCSYMFTNGKYELSSTSKKQAINYNK